MITKAVKNWCKTYSPSSQPSLAASAPQTSGVFRQGRLWQGAKGAGCQLVPSQPQGFR